MFSTVTNSVNMKIAKRKNVLIVIIFLLAFFIGVQGVLAAKESEALKGLNTTAQEGYGADYKQTIPQNIPTTIGKVIGAGLAFIGVLFFILMIYGGFIWMTARGNEQQVEKARDLIAAAIIGLIIVLAAYAITTFIGEELTKPSS